MGDFHALPSACQVATDLVRTLASGAARPAIGVELAHGRDQRALDAFLAGTIGERELRLRLRDREEWGYPWEGPRALLAEARALRVPVVALDAPPRGGVADLRVRDAVAAARIAALVRRGFAPVLVVFGEAHLASAHLPRRLAREGVPPDRIVRVFADLPLGGTAPELPTTLSRTEGGAFVAHRLLPSSRPAALARTWRRWAATESCARRPDVATTVHGLFTIGLASIGLDPRAQRFAEGRFLADLEPEVLAAEPTSRALRRLAEAGLGLRAAERVLARARTLGASALPAEKILVVDRPDLSTLTAEVSRLLGRALVVAGQGGEAPPAETPWLELEETLAATILRLLDPVRARERGGRGTNHASPSEPVLAARRRGSRLADAVVGGSIDPAAIARAWIRLDASAERAARLLTRLEKLSMAAR